MLTSFYTTDNIRKLKWDLEDTNRLRAYGRYRDLYRGEFSQAFRGVISKLLQKYPLQNTTSQTLIEVNLFKSLTDFFKILSTDNDLTIVTDKENQSVWNKISAENNFISVVKEICVDNSRFGDNGNYINMPMSALNAILSGEISENSLIYDYISGYKRSTFDLSKFEVVGTPTISEDGVASGFSVGNYIKNSINMPIGSKWKINIPFNSGDSRHSRAQLLLKAIDRVSATAKIQIEINSNGYLYFWTKCLIDGTPTNIISYNKQVALNNQR